MPSGFLLTAIIRDPALIRAADEGGVDRIGIDIEQLGKHLRQDPSGGARFSGHRLEDLAVVAANVRRADLFARLNPLHACTRGEIDRAIEFGARVLMLPYFTETRDAASFVDMVAGRAEPVLLVETAQAAARIREIVALSGLGEIMVGLNDLARSMRLSHPFEVLGTELFRAVAGCVLEAGLRFGFGGVARVDDAGLPVPPDLIYAQYPLTGGAAAWLARSFFNGIEPRQVPAAVRQARDRLAYWFAQPRELLERRREDLGSALLRLAGRPV
jgi:hypothetical protein